MEEVFSVATDGVQVAVAFRTWSGFPDSECCSGVVQVFRKIGNDWQAVQIIIGERFEDEDMFGMSLAIRGEWLAVGAPGTDVGGEDRGSVHLYQRVNDEWQWHSELMPAETQANSEFGTALAFAGEHLVVSAPRANTNSISGAVYVYALDAGQWTLHQQLLANVWRRFGMSLAAEDDRIVVGVPDATSIQPRIGEVHVYQLFEGDWIPEQVLTPNNQNQFDFGASVAIANGVIVVGDPDLYKTFVFELDAQSNSWLQTKELANANGFGPGESVATNGDVIYTANRNPFFLMAFVRVGDDWVQSFEAASNLIPGVLWYGEKVAMSDDIVVLSPRGGGSFPASAYVVNIDLQTITDCNGNGTADEIDAIASELNFADCNANSVPDECEPGAVLDCNNNGYCDALEVFDFPNSDHNRNRIPDECEPADSDGDGVADVIDNCPELANPDQLDCDEDGVGDICAIAMGWSADCNDDDVPDECNEIYQLGDLYQDELWALNGYFDALFIKEHVVEAGKERVNGIQVRWPDPFIYNYSYYLEPRQYPVSVAIFRDPDDDGDPQNAVLIRRVDVQTGFGDEQWTPYYFEETLLGKPGDSFYVGVLTPMGTYYLPDNMSFPPTAANWVGVVTEGPMNLDDLSKNNYLAFIPQVDYSPAIRVVATLAFQCHCQHDIASVNGPQGDGVVNVHDLFKLLSLWGDCGLPCPPSCVADFNGDCNVNVTDLFLLLSAWGNCQ